MSLFSILEAFFIGPLKLLFEGIYKLAYVALRDPGLSIVLLSLAMNLLVLPLYRRADAMQEQARDTEARLREGVSHIKKTFSGNERMMMLQTYYRQNDYSPVNALRGSVSLLLEIPFFMAAYQFLSHLKLLQGCSFGPIADLGAPDGLLRVFGLTINVLPVLMTAINFVSSAIYLRGFPLKTKIQLYAMALFFLFFLYTSPAGLVFYWTLNNLFSLGKNIVCRLLAIRKKKARTEPEAGAKKRRPGRAPTAADRRLFFGAAAFLTVLTGLLIPSTYIAASPEEFVDPGLFFHPLWYVVSAAALAAGTFLLWFGVFYQLAGPKGKLIFGQLLWVVCAAALINYLFFGGNLGIISHTLQYDNGVSFPASEVRLNLLVLLPVCAVVCFLGLRKPKAAALVLIALTLAQTGLSAVNIGRTALSVRAISDSGEEGQPHFTLSRTENNVVVLFLDRAMGQYLPYLVNEKPELKESFDGFTYYSNVISFGGHTNFGAPALMGGYEYTPVELNRRKDELLVDKHNEALKVMPVLFRDNGFDVTVFDAPYANYRWIPDLSIYDDYPEIHKYLTKGRYGPAEFKQSQIENNRRNFFCFSLMKILPVSLQAAVYDDGTYFRVDAATDVQTVAGTSSATGMNQSFLESYNALCALKELTRISPDGGKSFMFFYNDTPHEPMLLQEPDYVPAPEVDNREYDAAHLDRFTVDGRSIRVKSLRQVQHYEVNMATLLQVADWLDYLKQEGVYDNTRIIIVADHGYYLYLSEELDHPEFDFGYGHNLDCGNYFPLMMVKDFNAHGFTTDSSFMTNADVPTIAFDGLIPDPINPFTGKRIDSSEKTAHEQLIITDHKGWDTQYNNGVTFLPCKWASVKDDIWDRSNWTFLDKPTVLTEHKIP